jgi:hypothetical protein
MSKMIIILIFDHHKQVYPHEVTYRLATKAWFLLAIWPTS